MRRNSTQKEEKPMTLAGSLHAMTGSTTATRKDETHPLDNQTMMGLINRTNPDGVTGF